MTWPGLGLSYFSLCFNLVESIKVALTQPNEVVVVVVVVVSRLNDDFWNHVAAD